MQNSREPLLLKLIVSAGGAGLVKKGPGTWGSLVGVALAWGCLQCDELYAHRWLVVATASLLSLVAIHYWEKLSQSHDDQRVVIDEVCGQAIPIFALGTQHPTYGQLFIAFALFRLFDIWKPGPVRWIDEKAPGAWGTFMDDIVAGGFAAVVTVYLAQRLGQ